MASFSTKTCILTKTTGWPLGVLTSLTSRLPLKKDTFVALEL